VIVQLTPRRLLQLIALGIRNGNSLAALDIIDDALGQLPETTEFTKAPPLTTGCSWRDTRTACGHALIATVDTGDELRFCPFCAQPFTQGDQ
jgi:hypothetical protein